MRNQSSPLDALFAEHELPVVPIKSLAGWEALDEPELLALRERYGPWAEPNHLAPRLASSYWLLSHRGVGDDDDNSEDELNKEDRPRIDSVQK